MPSRIAQTLCTTLFLIVLYFVDKTSMSGLWYLIPAGILAVGSFTLGGLINSQWYRRFPPKLTDYEKKWVTNVIPFYPQLSVGQQRNFGIELARAMQEKDFVSMAEKDIPEEVKMMVLAPAVRLKLSDDDRRAEHYNKIILYHHAFASPDQRYLHLSETQHEDGALIFATDALEAAYVKPDSFFNTALYEWSCVFVHLYRLRDAFHLSADEAWPIITELIHTTPDKLLPYLRQPSVDIHALLCYCYVMHPSGIQKHLPEFYDKMKNAIG